MELTLVGLQNAGKTTLVNVLTVLYFFPICNEHFFVIEFFSSMAKQMKTRYQLLVLICEK